jgi:hypothetical protein
MANAFQRILRWLLETAAPPEAIICAPAMFGDRYTEEEYVVDRRRIKVVQRLSRRTSRSSRGDHP